MGALDRSPQGRGGLTGLQGATSAVGAGEQRETSGGVASSGVAGGVAILSAASGEQMHDWPGHLTHPPFPGESRAGGGGLSPKQNPSLSSRTLVLKYDGAVEQLTHGNNVKQHW